MKKIRRNKDIIDNDVIESFSIPLYMKDVLDKLEAFRDEKEPVTWLNIDLGVFSDSFSRKNIHYSSPYKEKPVDEPVYATETELIRTINLDPTLYSEDNILDCFIDEVTAFLFTFKSKEGESNGKKVPKPISCEIRVKVDDNHYLEFDFENYEINIIEEKEFLL